MFDSPDFFDVKEEQGQIERIKQCYSKSIIPNLLHRELTGNGLYRVNPFGPVCPERLRMPIEHIIPRWAMEAGNIFMGFTECGRYLLSYTVRSTESDFGRFLWSDSADLTFEYRLHFWLFTPNAHVRKVCSVTLFDNYGICHDNLLIEISQWKDDQNRLLVTGRSTSQSLPPGSQQFVTITTIPDVRNCSNCHYGPPEEGYDDDFGEVRRTRTTCVRHGLTIHFAYEQVQPFPRFNPDIMLRFKDSVVLNTGNLFHMFSIKLLEPKQTSKFCQELLTIPPDSLPSIFGGDGRSCRRRQRHLRCDFWLKNCRHSSLLRMSSREVSRLVDTSSVILTEEAEIENSRKVHAQEVIASMLPDLWSLRYPPMPFLPTPRKRRQSQSSLDSEISSSSEKSSASDMSNTLGSPGPDPIRFLLNARMARENATAEASRMPPPDGDGRKFFKRLRSPIKAGVSPDNTTLTIYDIFEETIIDRNFSSFRKRRLADKKYEFNDADLDLSENIIPLKMSRKSSPSKIISQRSDSPVNVNVTNENSDNPSPGCPRSPRGCSLSISPAMSPGQGEILRAITNTSSCGSPLISPPTTVPTTPEDHTRKRSTSLSLGSGAAKNARPNFSTNFNCIAKVLRCYAEDDDGSFSVKTDTDEEYKQTLPFPVALQLKVHGTAYRPLAGISNSRSRNCSTPVVEVLQRSLDIEVLCNEVSGIMCLAADKYYSSCFDYDVDIVDVCQERGSITAVAYVLMTAMSLRRSQQERYSAPNSRDLSPIPGLSDQKQKYEAMFIFMWEPVEERCRILYTGNLKELSIVPKQWHPTKRLIPNIRSRIYDTPFASNCNKTLKNDLAVKDWQSLDELKDSQGIITLYRVKRQKKHVNSNSFPSPAMSSESSPGEDVSVTTSDDDETEDNWMF